MGVKFSEKKRYETVEESLRKYVIFDNFTEH